MFILISIAVPSLHLLCLQDSLCASPLTSVKVLRNQWNWQSIILEEPVDHIMDLVRMDNVSLFERPLVLKANSIQRLLVTRTDVLHSLGMPSLGIKLDSMPGRLNTTVRDLAGQGLLQGSCYELCGRGHSIMPFYTLVV